MGNLNRRRAIGAARAAVRDDAVVCRGPRRKGSLPTARLRGHKRTTVVPSMRSPDGAPGLVFGKPEDRLRL